MEISKANIQMDTNLTNTSQKTSGTQEPSLDIQIDKKDDQTQQNHSISEKLADIAKKLNEQMDSLDTNVRFGYSDTIDSMYISVTEKGTGKEIRRIPSEEAMKLTKYFRDAIGMIFDKES